MLFAIKGVRLHAKQNFFNKVDPGENRVRCNQHFKELIMRKYILVAMAAALICMNSGMMANATQKAKNATVKGTTAVQKQDQAQQSFSGLVKKSGKIIFLETDEGVFRLKGKDLQDFVGKKVAILGTINSQNGSEHIVVAKAVITQ